MGKLIAFRTHTPGVVACALLMSLARIPLAESDDGSCGVKAFFHLLPSEDVSLQAYWRQVGPKKCLGFDSGRFSEDKAGADLDTATVATGLVDDEADEYDRAGAGGVTTLPSTWSQPGGV